MTTNDKLIRLLTKRLKTDGFHHSAVPLVDLIKFSETKLRTRSLWSSSLVIILQGHKEISLETKAYKYKHASVIVTPVSLPVISRIVVESPKKPFLAIKFKFDPLELHEVASKFPAPGLESELKTHGILSGPADESILTTTLRLLELSDEDAPVLGPMILRELYYHFLKSEHGQAIRQFILAGSKLQAIAQAVTKLRHDLRQELDVEEFARTAHMSRTLFFSTFKKVTAMSPIQYQKKLRLLEARHLLSTTAETAENAAFAVGYKSASQFSREFSRMFGHSPKSSLRN